MTLRAEIMAIGDELTTGQRLDTNSQWLAEELTALGCEVGWHTTIGDDADLHAAAFQTAFARAHVVVATGGLGPTADDLTRQALAAATGRPLQRNAAALDQIRRLFAQRGRAMPERNALQADFPAGAQPIPNAFGTAPGIALEATAPDGRPCPVFCLPVVPAEMKPMWREYVAPAVAALSPERRARAHFRLKCFGVGESELEALIPEILARDRRPLVGITVSDATITLRITADGSDAAACRAAMESTIAEIRARLGDLVFGEEDEELHDVVLQLLARQGATLATAEWASGGCLAQALADADAPAAFRGGWVVSQLDAVRRLFPEASPPLGEPHGAALAAALAQQVRSALQADFGLAVAAYPPDRDCPEGRVAAAIATADRCDALAFPSASHPAIRRQRTAKHCLNEFRKLLLGGGGGGSTAAPDRSGADA